eukprot:GHVQ01019521.1.p1 GENE.GHVQ01019521.1~~GHVQ01019521.1.p1  ORF type:complete len:227 (-),score=18.35 GHVQ01019521.1:611-1291(-)
MEPYVVPTTLEDRITGPKLIVILEQACLELTHGKNHTLELLNNLDHRSRLRKQGRDPSDIRPDITHQCLMMLLDSPLNRAGLLLVYIRTAKNEMIQVSPQLTVPRTWPQFAAMAVTFLQKRKIKAVEKNCVLIKMIKNDVDSILPPGGHKIGFSVHGTDVVLRDYLEQYRDTTIPVTIVIGAVAHGDPAPDCSFVDEPIRISSYGLSAAVSPGVHKGWCEDAQCFS